MKLYLWRLYSFLFLLWASTGVAFACSLVDWGYNGQILRQSQVFWSPRVDGYRLNYCYDYGRGCGELVAKAWCHAQHYQNMTGFRIERDVGRTIYLGSYEFCYDNGCDGFAWIKCAGLKNQGVSLIPTLNSTLSSFLPPLFDY